MDNWNALIALDDFGTGYNSEYALITMHPDIIKIDRSIIEGCDKDISKYTMIRNLVKIARENNVKVLAEGIETRSEMETVIRCGADYLQGYYLSRPVFEPNGISEKVKKEITECK
jgi:EAL domain-containing protein (putative c-di-GMP-specific phosphodiesterase class I)